MFEPGATRGCRAAVRLCVGLRTGPLHRFQHGKDVSRHCRVGRELLLLGDDREPRRPARRHQSDADQSGSITGRADDEPGLPSAF